MVWKRDDVQEPQSVRPSAPPQRSESPSHPLPSGTERATIGRSISIRGDVTGEEDLLIQGRVEGTVSLKQHTVTVGPEGVVIANVSARKVTVEGEVKGDLRALEHLVLRSTARVEGDLAAPRVVLEEGSTFRGSVDMSDPSDTSRAGIGQAAKPTAPRVAAVVPAVEPPKPEPSKP